jgi:hypothetical protein
MPDFTLPNGREITFDLDAITLEEYRALLSPKQDKTEEDDIMSRACGLTVDEYHKLPHRTWRRLCKAFFEYAMGPLADPNSASESTST